MAFQYAQNLIFEHGIVDLCVGDTKFPVHKDILHGCVKKQTLTLPDDVNPKAVDHFLCLMYGVEYVFPDDDPTVHVHAWKVVDVAEFLDAYDGMWNRISKWFAGSSAVEATLLYKAERLRDKMHDVYAAHMIAAAELLIWGYPIYSVFAHVQHLSAETVAMVWDVVYKCENSGHYRSRNPPPYGKETSDCKRKQIETLKIFDRQFVSKQEVWEYTYDAERDEYVYAAPGGYRNGVAEIKVSRSPDDTATRFTLVQTNTSFNFYDIMTSGMAYSLTASSNNGAHALEVQFPPISCADYDSTWVDVPDGPKGVRRNTVQKLTLTFTRSVTGY